MNKGVSIILCTYNGSEKLADTLNHIITQNCSFSWELLLIDNASTDNTFEFASAYLSNSTIDYRVLNCKIPGKMNAFWLGINESKYEYLLDCDDDNHLKSDYLQIGLEILYKNKVIGALGGRGIPKTKIDLPDWFNTFGKSYAIGKQLDTSGELIQHPYLYGAGCFYKRAPLIAIQSKGFSSILTCRIGSSLASGGDTELCIVLRLLGYQIWFEESLIFEHEIHNSKLNWQFYLKLKRGISSSFPLLNSYEINKFKTINTFKISLFKSFFLVIKGVIKSYIIFSFKNDRNTQIARTITITKFKSFFSNYRLTIESYKKNKLIFKSL